ncbi:MAG: hypothetical protein GX575_23845 [Candidatus Anammoximicrobium sp.]|nr:hypothetical protein [Candidatus Anammoximicrobium sp.]
MLTEPNVLHARLYAKTEVTIAYCGTDDPDEFVGFSREHELIGLDDKVFLNTQQARQLADWLVSAADCIDAGEHIARGPAGILGFDGIVSSPEEFGQRCEAVYGQGWCDGMERLRGRAYRTG